MNNEMTYDDQIAVSTRMADIVGYEVEFTMPMQYAQVVFDTLNVYDTVKEQVDTLQTQLDTLQAQYDALVASQQPTGGK